MNANKFNKLFRKLNTDVKAFEQLYNEFYPKIVFHLRRCFGNQISAEEIAQELFLKLLKLEQKETINNPTAWLFTLAENLAKNTLDKIYFDLPLHPTFPAPFDIDSLILSEDMKKYLSALDKTSQTILYMHFWEGYSFKEISDVLGIEYVNLRKRVSRAYAELKKFFSKN